MFNASIKNHAESLKSPLSLSPSRNWHAIPRPQKPRLKPFNPLDGIRFNADDPDFDVLDFLDTFNAHSGVLAHGSVSYRRRRKSDVSDRSRNSYL